jgi:tetratricopeptide (TPR) repeat protein
MTRKGKQMRKANLQKKSRRTATKKTAQSTRRRVKPPGGRKKVQTNSEKKVRRRSSSRRISAQNNNKMSGARRAEIHPLDRAIAELRAELARTPDDSTLMGRLAALHYRRGDLESAESVYREALRVSPGRPTLYNNLGNVLCDMGRMRDGIAAYETAIEFEKAADPAHQPSPEAVVNLELAKVENKLIHERIEYLEKAAQLDVSSAEAMNALGCAYLLRGQRVLALDTFRKAARMDLRNVDAALNVALCHTLDHGASENTTAVLAEVAASILRFPGEARLYLHQAELYENAGMMDEAEQRYVRALQSDPFCLQAYDLLGRLRLALGTLSARDEASETASAALKKVLAEGTPFNKAFAAIARARFRREDPADAAQLDELLRDTDGDPRAPALRAQLMEAQGRLSEAVLVLDQACARFPSDMKLWIARASLALRSGEIDAAVSAFDRATLAAPQSAAASHSLRFAFEGYRRYRAERVRFESAVRMNPRDGMAHHHMALAALSVLKHEEALFHFTRALDLDPRLSDAACGRGRALQRMGHYEEAESSYEKALEIDPENAEAQRSLVGLRTRRLTAGALTNGADAREKSRENDA